MNKADPISGSPGEGKIEGRKEGVAFALAPWRRVEPKPRESRTRVMLWGDPARDTALESGPTWKASRSARLQEGERHFNPWEVGQP